MSFETDLAKFKKQVDSFSIAGASGNFHTGFSIGDDTRGAGAGVRTTEPNTPEEILTSLENSLKNFTIRGGHDVSVAGSLVGGGFAISAKQAPSGEGTGGGGPTPIGACCIGAECSILTADDCATMGGTYQGDDVECVDVTCGICPELTLVCDQICNSIAITKCGFEVTCINQSTEGDCCSGSVVGDCLHDATDCDVSKFFKVKTETWVGCDNVPNSVGCPDPIDFFLGPSTGTLTKTSTYDPSTCEVSIIDSGQVDTPYCEKCDETATSIDVCGDCLSGTFAITDGGLFGNACVTYDIAYSDEYTTAELIAAAEAALPSYDGVFEDSCAASYSISMDESSLSICRFRYKWTLAAATANCTITWNEHTDFDDMTTSDNPRSTSISIGDTETSVFECFEPTANGTTTITDVACTVD